MYAGRIFLPVLLLLITGCQLAAKPSGDPAATAALRGKRIGLVVRTAKYLGIDKRADHIYKQQRAHEAPDATYLLAYSTPSKLAEGLKGPYEIIQLDKYTQEIKKKEDFVFQEELLLVSPTEHRTTLPPDDALRHLMQKENLEGLLVVDEFWTVFTQTNLLSCKVDVRLLNASGSVVFQGETSGSKQISGFLRSLTNDLTLGATGGADSEEMVLVAKDASRMAGENTIKLLEAFITP